MLSQLHLLFSFIAGLIFCSIGAGLILLAFWRRIKELEDFIQADRNPEAYHATAKLKHIVPTAGDATRQKEDRKRKIYDKAQFTGVIDEKELKELGEKESVIQ